ncbi:hypothetical protein N234_17140 [Ralstonia pickettii DTP0602]|nr:hypothetical protein N234_17140 [Ralstonia pickettii DTP0602]
MNSFDYWLLCDELSISQAAHLIIGMAPGEVDAVGETGGELTGRSLVEYRTNLSAAQTALANAIVGERLPGNIQYVATQSWDTIAECMTEIVTEELDLDRTTLLVSDLKKWLWERGLRTGFFFPDSGMGADYLNPRHPRYAPKLAAAVRAWEAVPDTNGRHPKQALTKWLREHGVEFGLTDLDGKPNETGIEEIAKVANWQPSGGAPKTPGT